MWLVLNWRLVAGLRLGYWYTTKKYVLLYWAGVETSQVGNKPEARVSTSSQHTWVCFQKRDQMSPRDPSRNLDPRIKPNHEISIKPRRARRSVRRRYEAGRSYIIRFDDGCGVKMSSRFRVFIGCFLWVVFRLSTTNCLFSYKIILPPEAFLFSVGQHTAHLRTTRSCWCHHHG